MKVLFSPGTAASGKQELVGLSFSKPAALVALESKSPVASARLHELDEMEVRARVRELGESWQINGDEDLAEHEEFVFGFLCAFSAAYERLGFKPGTEVIPNDELMRCVWDELAKRSAVLSL